MNINLKIEAKKNISPRLIKICMPELTSLKILNLIYLTFNKDLFLLPYKVNKLSKKAKRNQNLKGVF